MRIVLFFLGLFLSIPAFAQTNISRSPKSGDPLQISILTCGVGNDLYASFGHIGIRVQDAQIGRDEVYNYGTFDYSDPNFYSKFVSGKLLYFISKSSFSDFIREYKEENRSVVEQVLALPEEKKAEISAYLEQNMLPQNKSYHYDFLFDNCATRIRDIFPKTLGSDFYWGEVLREKKISYRTILNQYLTNKNWERLGINLLLGSPVDSLLTDEGSMFLPDFLHEGLAGAHYQNLPIVQQENKLISQGTLSPRTLNGPLWMMIGVLILTILAFHVPAFFYLKPVIRFVLLFVSGLLGLFILFMWVGTNHQSCSDNYNILWALPTNLVIAFIANKKKALLKIYGLVGISCLMVALIIHVIGIQKLPLIELSPLLLSLMYIYIDFYKNNISVPLSQNENNTSNPL